uniref:Uncharacterized protein n=1 Tax=Arundo donax TaxID=35708 RepID=A0A0A8YWX0_ARUDO
MTIKNSKKTKLISFHFNKIGNMIVLHWMIRHPSYKIIAIADLDLALTAFPFTRCR